jgi:energy-coupling factor transporter ATP-binding protein EcfA2
LEASRSPAGESGAPSAPAPLPAPLIDARRLSFRYPDRAAPVLSEVGLRLYPGEHLLLEGRSGGGKSTLGKLLAGLRVPQSGLLLLVGLDRQTLGAEGWRRRVLMVPQFHENHVLMGTFAFNLLMGRGWPPQPSDLEEAQQVCQALGLGPLIERMPAGLQQWVGETGWQLSHGERDRLYMARALLQGAEVLILDESFAALDPHSVQQTLGQSWGGRRPSSSLPTLEREGRLPLLRATGRRQGAMACIHSLAHHFFHILPLQVLPQRLVHQHFVITTACRRARLERGEHRLIYLQGDGRLLRALGL